MYNDCVEEVLQIRGVLSDLDVEIKDNVKIYEDNTSTICLTKNKKLSNSKHIDIRYHFVYDYEKQGLISLKKYRLKTKLLIY